MSSIFGMRFFHAPSVMLSQIRLLSRRTIDVQLLQHVYSERLIVLRRQVGYRKFELGDA